jgi:succinoglycan biosynthesis transport protein ExoP
MNSDHHDNDLNENPPPGIGIDDICFTLFRHKWLILGFICLGLVAAAGMRITHPPKYASRSELMVKFVVDKQAASPMTQDGRVLSAESSANIMSTEIEMIKSLDVAKGAAMLLSPEVVTRMGLGTNRMWAAGVIESGIEVENPRSTSILAVMFKHRDQTIVQPALDAIITAYKQKHNSVYGYGAVDSVAVQKRDEYRQQLAATDEEIKALTATNHLVSVEDAKHTYQKQIDDWQDRLHTLEAELVRRTAILGSVAVGTETNTSEAAVPSDKIVEYTDLVSQIENLKRNKQELRLHYTEQWPTVINVQNRIDQATKEKTDLETQFPALAHMTLAASRGGTNSAQADLGTLRGIKAEVDWTRTFVSNLQWQAQSVLAMEPRLNDLQRQRNILETNYITWSRIIGDAMNTAAFGPNMINMSVIQEATPPWRDTKKLMKLLVGAFGGCAAAGFALAFLLDFVLNRTINRSADAERHLKLPVLLSIPDFSWNRNGKKLMAGPGSHTNGENGGAVTVWDPRATHIEMYADGLRERLMTYFESRNLNLKKPKLVAVTECGEGAGVTVIANNLAASLSRTSGNVLLVDMKGETGAARAFYGGRPGTTVSNLLDPESVTGALPQASEPEESNGEENNNKLACALPSKFTHIVPKLRASDYDYIVFDMPAISPMSATPRLGGYMDIVLLVLEAEKTGQQLAARATALMRESRANVVAVVNKYRPHVPARLSQEL